MVREAAKQAQEAFVRMINENPTVVRFAVYPTKDNGDGVQIPDFSKQFDISAPEVVRISKEQGSVGVREENIGMSTNQKAFVELLPNTGIKEGALICDGNGSCWSVGLVTEVSVFGEIVGKRAPIDIGKPSRSREILSISLDEYEATNVGDDYTIAVPSDTDLALLLPVFTFAERCAVFPFTAQDFTNPVEYTIYSESLEVRKIKLSIVGSL